MWGCTHVTRVAATRKLMCSVRTLRRANFRNQLDPVPFDVVRCWHFGCSLHGDKWTDGLALLVLLDARHTSWSQLMFMTKQFPNTTADKLHMEGPSTRIGITTHKTRSVAVHRNRAHPNHVTPDVHIGGDVCSTCAYTFSRRWKYECVSVHTDTHAGTKKEHITSTRARRSSNASVECGNFPEHLRAADGVCVQVCVCVFGAPTIGELSDGVH